MAYQLWHISHGVPELLVGLLEHAEDLATARLVVDPALELSKHISYGISVMAY